MQYYHTNYHNRPLYQGREEPVRRAGEHMQKRKLSTCIDMNAREIREMAVAFQKSRIVLTAYELDLFTRIGAHSLTSEVIAGALDLNRSATERLLNALTGLGLLEKRHGKFSNTQESRSFLSRESPDCLAGLMHSNHLWNTWSRLTEVVRTGKPAHRADINERGEDWLEAFILAMHDRGKRQAPDQVSTIDLQNVGSVLDVGGGSGCYSMALMGRKPGLKATVFDLPNVIPISKKIVEQEGFSGRIEHYAGDYMTDDLPKGFDLVFLSAIIHSNSFEANQALVKKCYDSLRTNGKIVIQDWVMNDDKTDPPGGAIFSINMLVGVEGGDCYSEQEIRTWLTTAGFSDFSKVDLEQGLGQVTGIKRS
jgi:SAM-dependent methyltransferase